MIQKLDIAILGLIAAIPVVCIIIFLLPRSLQDALWLNTRNLEPLTFITASFVHGDLGHLTGNLTLFVLAGILLYSVSWKAHKQKFLFCSLLLLIASLPMAYTFCVLNIFRFQLPQRSGGLSIVNSGLIGLTIPSLLLLLNAELQNTKTRLLFFISLLLLTDVVTILPYVESARPSNLAFAAVEGAIGLLLFSFPFRVLVRSGAKRQIALAFIVLTAYFCCFPLLFPAIVVRQGVFVDVFAHRFGLFFGLLLGYLLQVKSL